MIKKRNKKAGFEMSITTLVIIVIAVVMLILGLVFVRQIFGTASKSISIVDEQVRGKLQTLFGDTGRNPVVYSSEVSVKPGDSLSIPFAAKVPEGAGTSTKTSDLKYSIVIGEGNCVASVVKEWFTIPAKEKIGVEFNNYGTATSFDSYQPEAAYQDMVITVPSDINKCSQRIQIWLWKENKRESSNYFTLKVIRGGLF